MSGKPKVLIVDDDQQLILLLASHLRGAGYPTLAAVDAVQGFMFAQREQPGLVLLDVAMPAGGGLSLLEKLVKTLRTQLIPVIVITASSDPGIEAAARAKGAAAFLRKPIDRDALLAAVEAALARA
jgi:CheY-like chemotaxis protein